MLLEMPKRLLVHCHHQHCHCRHLPMSQMVIGVMQQKHVLMLLVRYQHTMMVSLPLTV
jgi:hypothetical protein